jgi:hypothetical protein
MLQRGGDVVIQMLENVQQKTIAPLLKSTVAPGTVVMTDEYDNCTDDACLSVHFTGHSAPRAC